MDFDFANLMEFLQEDIKKYEGIMTPVKAGFAETRLVKKVPCDMLHPNPDDEFCMPSVGPNTSIILNYERKIRKGELWSGFVDEEPVYVQKVYPEGYMILNGHHRWVATMKAGWKKIPVKIVNLTSETDIRQMLSASSHDKRVTFDLDEVVFCTKDEDPCEAPLRFPNNKKYKERLRRGMPAIFHTLVKNGYDVWFYTKEYYSIDYLKRLFQAYHMDLTGIVTGYGRKQWAKSKTTESLEKTIMQKYSRTLNVTLDDILLIDRKTGEFKDVELHCSPGEWPRSTIMAIKEFHRKTGEKNE